MERIKKFFFQNSNIRQTLVKNTLWIGISTTLIKVFRAGIIIYAARLLGTEAYGVFTYATGIVAIFAVFSDMGISSILVREISRNTSEIKKYFSTSLFIKAIFLTGMMMLILGFTPLLSKFAGSRTIIPIIALSIVFESLRTFLYSIPRAESKLQHEAILSIINEFFCILLITVFFLKSPSPKSLACSFMIGNAIGFISTLFFTRKYIFDSYKYFTRDLIFPLIKLTLPFAILGVFGIFMTNIDSVIIGLFGNEHMLGLFGAAQRPIGILYIIPGFLSVSLLPIISKMIKDNETQRIISLINNTTLASLLIALPLMIGGILTASPLISGIFGISYAGSISTFQLLLCTLLFVFPGTIYAEVLIALNKQKVFLVTGVTGALVNIGLDFILIPKYGINGSAIATIFAQALVNIIFFIAVRKTYKISIGKSIFKSMFATLIMALFAYTALLAQWTLIPVLIISMLIYFAILFLSKDTTLIQIKKSFK